MVIISHDRFFIERTTDKVMALLGDRTLRMLPRGIDEYLERRRAIVDSTVPVPAQGGTAERAPSVSAKDDRAAKKELQKIERQLGKMSDRETTLHQQIADSATDFEKVAGLDAELRELVSERDELEMRWMELAEDA
jgi:ATP-binding cassette subfamily F protein uup